MFLKFNLKSVLVATLAVFSVSVQGQDLLARQAPIDKKMRAIDSVSLQRLIGNELLDNPAGDLYQEWSNQHVHHERQRLSRLGVYSPKSLYGFDRRCILSKGSACMELH